MKKPNIRDVAEKAQVSEGTVSNVLNRPSYVSEELRERVRKAMEDLNYAPRESARQFRSGRVRNIGLVLADMSNPFFIGIALGALEVARKAGVGLVVCHSSEDPAREQENLELLLQQRVQGIILAQVYESSDRLSMLVDREVPVVLVDRVTHDVGFCSVTTDERLGGRLAGEYLSSKGYSSIGYVGDLKINPKVRLRLEGVREGASGITSSILHIPVLDWNTESGIEGARIWSLLPDADKPRALVCANDLVALGLTQELWRRGYRVPGDVAIIGYDDLDMASNNTIPLTTIRQPRTLVGRTAAKLILQEIEAASGDHEHRDVTLSPSLIIRETA